MDSKRLSTIFKALSTHVSRDQTREALMHVHARDAFTLEATDGHRLLSVRAPAGHGLTPGLYDAKDAIARFKANVPAQLATLAKSYPDVPQVLAGYERDDDAASTTARMVAANPSYVGDLAYAVDTIRGRGSIAPMELRWPTNPMAPIRVNARCDDAEIVGLVMPMRA